MKFEVSESSYTEMKSGDKAPLSNSVPHVNKFINDESVRFEDLQKLCFDLAFELADLKKFAADADDLISRLKKLNYRQLLSVRESLGQIIRKKDDEPRVDIWVLSDQSDDLGYFEIDQYLEASEKMAELVRAEAGNNPNTPMQFLLERRRIRQSEVPMYLDGQ